MSEEFIIGRRWCAWCNSFMGWVTGDAQAAKASGGRMFTTHGICSKCAAKMDPFADDSFSPAASLGPAKTGSPGQPFQPLNDPYVKVSREEARREVFPLGQLLAMSGQLRRCA
jgi:hypothetical protein